MHSGYGHMSSGAHGRLGLVAGTRPNFVKAASVLRALAGRGVRCEFVHTGQHYDPLLSEAFLGPLGLPDPDHHLGVGPGSRGEQFGEIVARLSHLLAQLRLELLIVVGDVTSTAAAAVAADACDVPIAHVEAGLRSFDETMPEERNRRVVDTLSRLLFVTEPAGVENLRREGRPGAGIHLVGNVMIDTLMRFRDEIAGRQAWRSYGVEEGGYAVATLHRPSNVDTPEVLGESLAVLGHVAERWPVLFSAHPRTQLRLRKFRLEPPSGVRLLPPLDYFEFMSLVTGARAVLTDSGGAQEETSALGVPCLTMRESTERPITVELGTSRLVGRSLPRVDSALAELDTGTLGGVPDIPFWDGRAAERIADVLLSR
jgi:UDP-N-acetylglucosamine 2-epimerase (non-hydrolysing)